MELLFLRLAKDVGGLALIAWLGLGGMVLALPLALLSGPPPGGAGALVAALAVNAINVAASALYFVALERGRLAVISPIVTAQAPVAVVLGVLVLGEQLSPAIAIGCAGAAVGVALAAMGSGGIAGSGGAGVAALSAILYGAYIVLIADVADDAGTFWTVLTFRIAVSGSLVPWLLARGGLRRPPWLLLGGALVLETAGFAAYVEAFARGPVAVAAPLAIQYSTIAVVLAAVVLHERLRARQWCGVALVIASVTAVAAT